MKYLILILLFSSISHADICEENILRGNTYLICAKAERSTESDARSSLSLQTRMDFDSYCSYSKECRRAEVKVIPKRTECTEIKVGNADWLGIGLNKRYKCVSLTAFEIN